MSAGADAIRAAAGRPELYALPGGRRGRDDPGGPELNRQLADRPRNDIGNGERLIARHGADLMYVTNVGEHVWAGTHWQTAGAPAEWRRRAHETVAAMAEEVSAMQASGPPDGWSPNDWSEEQLRHMRWMTDSGSSGHVSGMQKEARPYLTVEPAALDSDPFDLNLLNGTLRLEGACETLRPHRPEDRLSKLAPVAYDPAAAAPRFEAFLHRVQPDPEIRAFLQRWAGYNLTGSTREQKLVFFYGEGGNGKSVFVDLLARLLADYATTLGIASLMDQSTKRRGGDATPDLARLVGARMVRASEPEQGARFAEAAVKSMTGGEAMEVRHLNQNFFEFDPEFKLTISGNHKPYIRGQDRGIWRRFLLVPWEQNIPEAEQDLNLPAALWAERSGVLNWALDGCRQWLEGGLGIPDAVRAATEEYREAGDPIGRFIADCVVRTAGYRVQSSTAYKTYQTWCAVAGENVRSQKHFSSEMERHGIQKTGSGVRFFEGIQVFEPAGATDSGAGGDDGYY